MTKRKKLKPLSKQDIKNEAFMRGYELGKGRDEKYTKLGKAIVDCLFEFFEPVSK